MQDHGLGKEIAPNSGAQYAEMLVLAALTYRGFSDLLSGEIHNAIVGEGVSLGLKTLTPVRGKWELAWGPATSRFGGLVDSSVMYVVRHTTDRERYVVAIRGTNPISVRDWTLGDVNVATLVEWPFATDGSSLSTSTAFGLRTLLQLKFAPLWKNSFTSTWTPTSTGLGLSRRWMRSPSSLVNLREHRLSPKAVTLG